MLYSESSATVHSEDAVFFVCGAWEVNQTRSFSNAVLKLNIETGAIQVLHVEGYIRPRWEHSCVYFENAIVCVGGWADVYPLEAIPVRLDLSYHPPRWTNLTSVPFPGQTYLRGAACGVWEGSMIVMDGRDDSRVMRLDLSNLGSSEEQQGGGWQELTVSSGSAKPVARTYTASAVSRQLDHFRRLDILQRGWGVA
jgi:hypothetical protein